MRIRIPSFQELNPGHSEAVSENCARINGVVPTLADCEIVDDNGKVITTEVEAIDIRMRCGEPIVATIRRFDVSAEIGAIQSEPKHGYAEGERHALIRLAGHLIQELADTEKATSFAHLMLRAQRERLEAVDALRSLCEKHGDNNWPDDLNLADVIQRHLRWEETR